MIDEDPDYDLSEVLISDRTNQLLGVAYDKDRLIYKPFDRQFARDLEISWQACTTAKSFSGAARTMRGNGSSPTTRRPIPARPISTTEKPERQSFFTARVPGCHAKVWRRCGRFRFRLATD